MEESDRDRPPSTRHGDEPSFGGQPLLNPINYQSEYQPDSQHRQQNYPPYSSNLVYNIPQQTHNSSYAPVQSYAPRQTAAIEVLSSQFAGSSQYYVPGESPTSVPTGVSHHPSSSQFSSPSYAQYSPTAARLPHAYASAIPELNQPPASEPVEDPEFSQQNHSATALDDAYNQYQSALKRTFQNMRDGRLGEAGTSLLTISDWLLSNAVELGLVRDEQELYGDRTRLWNEFNTCWLVVLQKEKEMLQEYIATGQAPQPPREILREEMLERMGRELIALCDSMERHGLVDYQMGVWEEEILGAIQECLDLLEGNAESGAPPEGSASASAAARNPDRTAGSQHNS
ncbi:hypothetical protein L873DRAFT_1825076 [Choiromyces venosus 120613-1]|uniref:Uncharacterized protein n=1 Tax=Choiromyces venosus 120613-1 TaxID=1336337 RepID=A0A3N4K8L1_9PEZI|nr:hypothetical protein L873DRAFT_1825076 [Choiromyces venosus 120613-1]